ncbi:nuclear transport factor 2 family protein [Actinomadura darangshiensis]|uniref:Nuclear transport factor 2 family protein n=1 Tax=Actinomadura darangshiensis TaxID=705336 RepID=A0A4R5BBH4_9ACTN|nr:nuclear transport factor 2 family protein [Actinomadura darangshiensis]TDD83798.1 nuclear transport factor 2 family protein [Actinomadura darangshiensis]
MDLDALEEIRQAKYRYLRCLDLKDWDEFADTLTEDAVGAYGTRAVGEPLRLDGRDAIVDYMRTNLGPEIITVHFAGQPEIRVDGDEAEGIWCLEDTVIAKEFRVMIRGSAFYEEAYRRCTDGKWRISSIGYERTYEYSVSLDDVPSFRLMADRWAPAT